MSKLANRVADHYAEFYMHRHRGVDVVGTYRLIMFGNDCYQTDQRSKDEVYWLKDYLDAMDIPYEFGVRKSDGETWAIVATDIDGDIDPEDLNQQLWQVWYELSEKAAEKKKTDALSV